MTDVPEPGRWDDQRLRFLKVIAAALPCLGLLLASVLVLWVLGPVVDARPERVQRHTQLDHGAYLLTEEGTVRLNQWHLPLSAPPSDCPLLDATELRALVVVTGQPFDEEAYCLYRLEAGAVLAWRSVDRDGQHFMLDPGPLAPGGYLLTMPTHDLFGSKTYHYFRLQ